MNYILRSAQQQAVEKTFQYWQTKTSPREFLWNAKPRFGKTLAAYEFMQKISAKRTLIVTNRPAISSSWQSDYQKFLLNSPYIFSMRTAKEKSIFTREKIIASKELSAKPFIHFVSLQDLKNKSSVAIQRNRWIFETKWDLLIIDEEHDGIKTEKSAEVLSRIKTDFTLYLSGTPFRALAGKKFSDAQIYNYTYVNEQLSQDNFSPRFEFQLFDEEPDLLKISKLIKNHQHTFWFLSDVAACKKMASAIKNSTEFKKHQVIFAAEKNSGIKSYQKVCAAIKESPTITLSCQQLTTGITIPEWSAVLMLQKNLDVSRASAGEYIQTAFRAQNPCEKIKKQKTVIFDFNTARALTILNNYAENLCQGSLEKLFSTLDVYYKDKKLSFSDAKKLLQEKISTEIISHHFMSAQNILNFENIKNISPELEKIILKLDFVYKNRVTRAKKNSETHHVKPRDLAKLSAPPARSHHGAPRDYSKQLFGLTRNFPFLILLHQADPMSFKKLFSQVSSDELEFLANISLSDFKKIYDANILNEENLDFAIQNFSDSLNKNNFYLPQVFGTHILTPRNFAQKMLAEISHENQNIFKNNNAKFFDPYCKSGIFLAEIFEKLFLSTRKNFLSDFDSAKYILDHQLFAFFPDKFAQGLSIKILENKFFNLVGERINLARHQNFVIYNLIPPRGNFNYAKIFPKIKQWNLDERSEKMKFDLIISNPPYQKGRRQVYADFYKLAVDLNPEILCMVFPIGWQKTYNHNGLGLINNEKYKKDSHIVSIDHYYENSDQKLFPEIGTGGVNIVLRDNNFDNCGKIRKLVQGKECGTMTLPITAEEKVKPACLKKLAEKFQDQPKLSELGTARKPYGFYSDPLRHPEKYHLKLSSKKQDPTDVRLFALNDHGDRTYQYIARESLPKISANLDAYKIFVPKAWGNMSERIGLGGSYANICVAKPGDVCSETFIEFGPFKKQETAIRMAKYFMTNFCRALLFFAKDSQNTARDKYKYIPVPNLSEKFFAKDISAIDNALLEKYKIDSETKDLILNKIQSRSEENIEIL